MTAPTLEEIKRALPDLVAALRCQQQADMDGTFVTVSRQACDEAADMLDALASMALSQAAAITSANARIAELSETWTDENATVWSPPTAWAYAKACAAIHAKAARIVALEGALRNLIENTRGMLFGVRGVAECSEDEMYGEATAALTPAEVK